MSKKETKYSAKYIDKTLLKPNKKIYKTLFTATDKCQYIWIVLTNLGNNVYLFFIVSVWQRNRRRDKNKRKQGKISNNLHVTIQ